MLWPNIEGQCLPLQKTQVNDYLASVEMTYCLHDEFDASVAFTLTLRNIFVATKIINDSLQFNKST